MFESRSICGKDMDKSWRLTFSAHPVYAAKYGTEKRWQISEKVVTWFFWWLCYREQRAYSSRPIYWHVWAPSDGRWERRTRSWTVPRLPRAAYAPPPRSFAHRQQLVSAEILCSCEPALRSSRRPGNIDNNNLMSSLCGRPDRPHYGSCSSFCLSVPCGLLKKQA